jgi:hypothetical protein
MEWAKTASSAIALGLSTAFDRVPTWALVAFLLIVGCGPEVRRMAESASNIAWRWRRETNTLT